MFNNDVLKKILGPATRKYNKRIETKIIQWRVTQFVALVKTFVEQTAVFLFFLILVPPNELGVKKKEKKVDFFF